MHTTYGLNRIEIARRFFGSIIALGGAGFFGWALLHIQLGFNAETIFCVILGLLLLGGGVWMLQSAFAGLWQNPRFQLHERGITLVSNAREIEWEWDELKNWSGKIIYNKTHDGFITTDISGSVNFLSDAKPTLVVDGLIQDAPKLVEDIITHAVNAQLPKQLEAFRQGKTLDFGSVTLNRDGLTHGKTFIPLGDIMSISINEVVLSVQLKSQPQNPTRLVIAGSLLMPELLLAVMDNLVRPSQAQ
jgi:hypothetical protein